MDKPQPAFISIGRVVETVQVCDEEEADRELADTPEQNRPAEEE